MKTAFSLLIVVLLISFCFKPAFSQSSTVSHDFTYSGSLQIYPNEQCMINKQSDNRFVINSNSNESNETGLYYVYFEYCSNFGTVNKGIYKIRVLKHIGSRMKETYFNVNVEDDKSSFYQIVALKKGVYSIRVYDENNVILSASEYFNVTSDKSIGIPKEGNSSASK